jgi:hypothetical protein
MWGGAAMLSTKQYYLGITNQGLVLMELDLLGKPVDIKRISFDSVQAINFHKDFLNDNLEINLKGGNPLKVRYCSRLK